MEKITASKKDVWVIRSTSKPYKYAFCSHYAVFVGDSPAGATQCKSLKTARAKCPQAKKYKPEYDWEPVHFVEERTYTEQL